MNKELQLWLRKSTKNRMLKSLLKGLGLHIRKVTSLNPFLPITVLEHLSYPTQVIEIKIPQIPRAGRF